MSNIVETYKNNCKYRRGTHLYIEKYHDNLIEGVSGTIILEEDIIKECKASIESLKTRSEFYLGTIVEFTNEDTEDYIFLLVEYIDKETYKKHSKELHNIYILNSLIGRILMINKEYNYKDIIRYRIINEEFNDIYE